MSSNQKSGSKSSKGHAHHAHVSHHENNVMPSTESLYEDESEATLIDRQAQANIINENMANIQASGNTSGLSQITLKQMHIQNLAFWRQINKEMDSISPEKEDFSHQELPLSRIKRLMKLEPTLTNNTEAAKCMISPEVPIILAKLTEIFLLEISLRAWQFAEEAKRRTLLKSDIARAIHQSEMYDFLIDVVPRDDLNVKLFQLTQAFDPQMIKSFQGGEFDAQTLAGYMNRSNPIQQQQQLQQVTSQPHVPLSHAANIAQSYLQAHPPPSTGGGSAFNIPQNLVTSTSNVAATLTSTNSMKENTSSVSIQEKVPPSSESIAALPSESSGEESYSSNGGEKRSFASEDVEDDQNKKLRIEEATQGNDSMENIATTTETESEVTRQSEDQT